MTIVLTRATVRDVRVREDAKGSEPTDESIECGGLVTHTHTQTYNKTKEMHTCTQQDTCVLKSIIGFNWWLL